MIVERVEAKLVERREAMEARFAERLEAIKTKLLGVFFSHAEYARVEMPNLKPMLPT